MWDKSVEQLNDPDTDGAVPNNHQVATTYCFRTIWLHQISSMVSYKSETFTCVRVKVLGFRRVFLISLMWALNFRSPLYRGGFVVLGLRERYNWVDGLNVGVLFLTLWSKLRWRFFSSLGKGYFIEDFVWFWHKLLAEHFCCQLVTNLIQFNCTFRFTSQPHYGKFSSLLET